MPEIRTPRVPCHPILTEAEALELWHAGEIEAEMVRDHYYPIGDEL